MGGNIDYTYLDTLSLTLNKGGGTGNNSKNVNIDVSQYKIIVLDFDCGGEHHSEMFVNIYNSVSTDSWLYVRNYNPDAQWGSHAVGEVDVKAGFMKQLYMAGTNHGTEENRTYVLKVYGLK